MVRRGAARLIKRALQFLREVKRPLPIVVVLCEESPYDLIKILGLFSVILRSWNFIKLNLPILPVLVRQREKSQRYFSLSSFNWNLNQSDLWCTLGAKTFQKWELFSGWPAIWVQFSYFFFKYCYTCILSFVTLVSLFYRYPHQTSCSHASIWSIMLRHWNEACKMVVLPMMDIKRWSTKWKNMLVSRSRD